MLPRARFATFLRLNGIENWCMVAVMRFEQNHHAASARMTGEVDASALALVCAGSVVAIAAIADALVKTVAVVKLAVPPGI